MPDACLFGFRERARAPPPDFRDGQYATRVFCPELSDSFWLTRAIRDSKLTGEMSSPVDSTAGLRNFASLLLTRSTKALIDNKFGGKHNENSKK